MLERLNPEQQRRIGGLFIESVLDLCSDARIRRAVKVAMDADSDEEIREDAFHSAKTYAVSTYTECGRDTDWSRQAAHFVGVATACLLSEEAPPGGGSRAWRVAMQVRNARNCALIDPKTDSEINDEAERQRRIADEFLAEAV
jgi:hypothetical protein